MAEKIFISIEKCNIENSRGTVLADVSWRMCSGECWLVIGPNGGGKADFLNAIAGTLRFVPNGAGSAGFSSVFGDSVEIVSLERAARIIEEERENDESEYIEGGVDIGRTGRVFICEPLTGKRAGAPKAGFSAGGLTNGRLFQTQAAQIERDIGRHPAIRLCGVEQILDRGLKYMSTGEIRRTLLSRALISEKKLLILSDPFAGLDVQSRKILLEFFNTIAQKQRRNDSLDFPKIILGMERWHEIPDAITHVLEFRDKKISFCGTRADYEKILAKRNAETEKNITQQKQEFSGLFEDTVQETAVLHNAGSTEDILVEMKNVNVGWGDHRVLTDLNWTLRKNEHWLIRGPNGSGKTTFLELITGDNMQVFCNDVKIFGNRRGSGESIWDIKKRLGIVSYRLHVEYRMVGGTSLRNTIISGFRDSIGLYEAPSDLEMAAAEKWLALGGFAGRENESFGNLSYGEQRAILILRSAVKTPKILILDEPCHGLDEQYRAKILHLIELIGELGTTTILHVTHDASEALPCEKHILELLPGEVPMYKIIEN